MLFASFFTLHRTTKPNAMKKFQEDTGITPEVNLTTTKVVNLTTTHFHHGAHKEAEDKLLLDHRPWAEHPYIREFVLFVGLV